MKFFLTLLLLLPATLQAKCVTNDTGPFRDNVAHFAVGAATAYIWDFRTSAAITITKELIDSQRKGHTCALEDIAYGLAGAYLGMRAKNWHFSIQRNNVQVLYSIQY